jgi:hypothetical protein
MIIRMVTAYDIKNTRKDPGGQIIAPYIAKNADISAIITPNILDAMLGSPLLAKRNIIIKFFISAILLSDLGVFC